MDLTVRRLKVESTTDFAFAAIRCARDRTSLPAIAALARVLRSAVRDLAGR